MFQPCLWNQYNTVLEDGMETNNMLESYNRTWNLLSGYSPNVWHIQDHFVKQDADARRAFLSNSVGQDMADNTGRKQRAKYAKQRVKLVVEAFATMPKTDYKFVKNKFVNIIIILLKRNFRNFRKKFSEFI